MARHGLNDTSTVDLPAISPAVFGFFSRYTARYLRRHFHSVRLAQRELAAAVAGRAVVVCLNHPSWWDPLVSLAIARAVFPARAHYAPIDAAALAKYRLFERIGFFGVEPGTAHGAAAFLRTGGAILSQPGAALWVTVQGEFADARRRPLQPRPGTGHLLHRSRDVAVLPLALEYPFWFEKYPEALARFGDPLLVEEGSTRTPQDWSAAIAARLEHAQQRLAEDSIARRAGAFETVLAGSAGIGGVYDAWRRFRARLTSRPFESAHGGERP